MLSVILIPCALLGLVYLALKTGRRAKDLPPGPPTLPILGNLHQIPKKGSYLKFTEWAKQYGGIYSLKLGHGTAVVITDRRIIKELVDKRSAKYSNRPASYVSHDLMTSGDHLLVMQYGQQWRAARKLVHQYFMESMVEKHHIEVQNAEAVQMLRDMCVRPDQHMRHPKRFSNSIIMSLVFGLRTPSVDTPHMTRLYDMMENWSQLMEPGATPPVDIYPLLHYIPQKFFGNWLSRSRNVGDEMNGLYESVLNRLHERRKLKGSKGSLMDTLLDQGEQLHLSHHQLYFLGGVLMEGGSDTTSSLVLAFIHAMTKWGQVLEKAQKEIDSVVGEDRTPVWSDYAQLPYVATIVKEVQRWRPVVPLAFPHAAAEDDWIDGYFIPKDTTVIINSWGMHHDEKRFPNPDTFDPDHYKGQTALAPELAAAADYENRDHYGYGSGRRICPGIHLAERNLFLAIAKLIWAFSIEPSLNDGGQPIEYDFRPETGYSEGFLVCVKDFPCVIKPRSEARRATIMKELEVAQRDVFSRFDI
ncbi:cytochrome P450 [Aspergillus bertholletiae]|uniref:Cytochrome P450 n=1 Tax=Aspergillus bertholletiae TaxID=1226010 RepID=A0A5N7APV5_9EURO|nr:cytochrome P450 [Aspergillus bertholletiae]